MLADHPQENPFAPPTADGLNSSLAPDTEFLFNESVVAGTTQIVLPQVCVISGDRVDLIQRDTRLSWCSRMITIPRNLLLLASVFWVLPALLRNTAGVPVRGAPSLPVGILQLGAGGVLAAAAGLTLLSMVFRTPVRVRWYLSKPIQRRHRRGAFAGFAIGLVCTIVALVEQSRFGMSLALGPLFISLALLWTGLLGRRPLLITGRHNDLFLIGGMSSEFFAEIRRMVAAWKQRTGASNIAE